MKQIAVVLHGLISLAPEPSKKQFRAFLIDMPDHRVAAGHWLTEMVIPKGALLHLAGVKTGGASKLDPKKNIIFPQKPKSEPINRTKLNRYRFAEIILPWPSQIESLNTTNIGDDLVGGPSGAKYISDTQVFLYDVVKGKRPSLVGDPRTPWKDLVFFETLAGATSMHILNEPDSPTVMEHVMEEFRRSAEIYNSAAYLKTGLTRPASDGVPAVLQPFLLHEELLQLSNRQNKVHNMVNAALVKPPVPYVSTPGAVGGNLVCSGGHGG